MNKRKDEIFTGVEIGSHSIKVLMGKFLEDDIISVTGASEQPSLKVRKGNIIDAAIVQEQLMKALAAAEKNSGKEIGDIFLAVTGGSVRSVSSIGSAIIHSSEKRITEENIVTALENAKAYTLSPDQMVLHHVDRRYLIDGTREVPNPEGQVGSRLEAEIQILYGRRNNIETFAGMLRDVMGYPVSDIAFSGVASGYGVLSTSDMEQGSLVIDVGSGVTEYVLFNGAGVYHSGQITVGVDHIANDLSLGLKLQLPRCRKILKSLSDFGGSVSMTPDGGKRVMEVEALGGEKRRIPVSSIEHIIELRLQELFEVIRKDIRNQEGLSRISNGITITGGGALLPGVTELVERCFDVQVEVGEPLLLSGQEDVLESPRYAAVAGLLRWGRMVFDVSETNPPLSTQLKDDIGRFCNALKKAFRW